MTVGELIELLADMDDEAEVRLMTQENWPFQCDLRGVCLGDDLEAGEAGVVYVVEGEQLGYGDKNAWKVASR